MARVNSILSTFFWWLLLASASIVTMASQISFSKDLYEVLAQGSEGNLFFSPFSIRTAMAMVHIGSSGNTEKQSQQILHLPENKQDIEQQFSNLLSAVKETNGSYELEVSNSAYVSNKLNVLDSFIGSLVKNFHASSQTVDFDNSEPVRAKINAKVEEDTRSKIKDLIPSGALNTLTRMVLVNAIYFKGLWETPFKVEKTEKQPFWINSGTSREVSMMHVHDEFPLASLTDHNARALALPYKGGNMQFVILLPNERDGLANLESSLGSIDFEKLLHKKMMPQKIKVALPKFKLELSVELVDYFQKMGMTDLFDAKKSDLSQIAADGELYVSKVFHKSFLEVNEEGSEAAAATGVIMMTRSMLPRKIDPFIADHPFLFMIYERKTNEVVFMGRFSSPATEE